MNERVAILSQALQEHGYRLTGARQAILGALVDCGGHVTADDLVGLVRRDLPSVGRMTVYRTLDLLHELGLIRPVYQGTSAAHYVLMEKGHHHHFICSGCDRVYEFDECMAKEIGEHLSDRFDFEIRGHLLEFYGLCPGCRDGRDGEGDSGA